MPKLTSAKKRLRQSVKRQAANTLRKEAYKNVKRQIKKALAQGNESKESLAELGKKFSQAVDKAAKTGVIHINKASREKARIMKFIGVSASAKSEVKAAKRPTRAPRKTARAKSAKASRKKANVHKAK